MAFKSKKDLTTYSSESQKKPIKPFLIIVISIALIPVLCFIVYFVTLTITGIVNSRQEKDFYADRNSFENISGIYKQIDRIGDELFFTLESVESDYEFRSLSFSLTDRQHELLINNGFFDEIHGGDEVTIIVAYGYFSPRVYIPLAGISANGKVYLDFDTGWESLMEKYK